MATWCWVRSRIGRTTRVVVTVNVSAHANCVPTLRYTDLF